MSITFQQLGVNTDSVLISCCVHLILASSHCCRSGKFLSPPQVAQNVLEDATKALAGRRIRCKSQQLPCEFEIIMILSFNHMAAIAAGINEILVRMHGIGFGRDSGMVPRARIAVYKTLDSRQSGGFIAAANDVLLDSSIPMYSASDCQRPEV